MDDIQTWRYSFPSENGEGWAIIFMDSIGCFTALSDWGNVAYRWPVKGWGEGDFRKFVLGCDDYYLTMKLGQNRREYDPEGTLAAVKARLDEMEKEGGKDATTARKERERLKKYDDLYTEHDLWQWAQDTSLDLSDGFTTQRYERDVTSFVAKVMPRLRARLQADLAATHTPAPTGAPEQRA